MTGKHLAVAFVRDVGTTHREYSGIIASVITFPAFKNFVGHPDNYDSLSGAVVSSFTGGCFLGAALAGWYVIFLITISARQLTIWLYQGRMIVLVVRGQYR